MLLLRRKESETTSPSNIRMMSRFWRVLLTPPDTGMDTMPQIAVVDNLVLRVRQMVGLGGGAEKAHHGTPGAKHAHDLLGQGLSRVLVKEVEEVPAEDAVDAGIRMPEARLEQAGKCVERTGFRVPIEIPDEVLDEQLAAEAVAEELDIGADDRTKVDENRRWLRGQRR